MLWIVLLLGLGACFFRIVGLVFRLVFLAVELGWSLLAGLVALATQPEKDSPL